MGEWNKLYSCVYGTLPVKGTSDNFTFEIKIHPD